ncbi:MAG: hypothetical protein Q7S22_02055 [Candidatus Micrarchaeota archaeon]|nr:hypothetical protein [Candidatus Micrarchaeota archaeon]
MSIQRKLFTSDAILRYSKGMAPDKLRHIYKKDRTGKDGKPMPFGNAIMLIDSVKTDVASRYKRETGNEFNNYQLGDMIETVREWFWQDARFIEAFVLLNLDEQHVRKASLPWWNVLAATEISHQIVDGGALITLGPRHALETQLVRQGIDVSIQSVSVSGIVETSDGLVAIGLRGGAAYPNTYHVNAGALGLLPEIISGDISIYDFYKRNELLAEFGVKNEDISSAVILSRIADFSIENGPMYNFLVRVNLTFEQLQAKYEGNKDQDKGEHTRLVSISKGKVMAFIEQHYKGVAANKYDRMDSERVLLHPGALALLSYTGEPLSKLERLFREGVW